MKNKCGWVLQSLANLSHLGPPSKYRLNSGIVSRYEWRPFCCGLSPVMTSSPYSLPEFHLCLCLQRSGNGCWGLAEPGGCRTPPSALTLRCC